MIGVHSNQDRYIKITPLIEGDIESAEPITLLTAMPDDATIMSVSVTENGLIKTRFKKPGTVNLTVTAENEDTGNEVTYVFTFFAVASTDMIDVIEGEVEQHSYSSGASMQVKGTLLNSVSFKIKDAYKDILSLVEDSVNAHYVTVTVENGVYTVTNTSLGTGFPQNGFIIKGAAGQQLGFIGTLFEMDPNEDYEVSDVDIRLSSYYGQDTRDGGTLTVSLADWTDKDIHAIFDVTPDIIKFARNVAISAVIADTTIAEAKSETTDYGRLIPIQIKDVGTTTVTLRVTDGMNYDETATITLTVTA